MYGITNERRITNECQNIKYEGRNYCYVENSSNLQKLSVIHMLMKKTTDVFIYHQFITGTLMKAMSMLFVCPLTDTATLRSDTNPIHRNWTSFPNPDTTCPEKWYDPKSIVEEPSTFNPEASATKLKFS